MSHRINLGYDGQAVTQDDFNDLGVEASTGEDHVYAQLFRLAPDGGSVDRGIVPYGTTATILPNGADGKVKINPFRVIIGSRTLVGVDAVANYQDVRSSLSIIDGATSLASLVQLSANTSGLTRWDAIVAVVTVDAASTPTTRKVKDPGTSVVTDQSVSIYTHTSVVVTKIEGTPDANPVFPSITADAGNIYYVLLGYIKIFDGFDSTTTLETNYINDASNCLAVSSANGVCNLRPATGNYKTGGAGISRTGTSGISSGSYPQRWYDGDELRPAAFLPSSMQGAESRLIVLDFVDPSSANWSHALGAIVDDSVDWSKRIFKWNAWVGFGAGSDLPWNYNAGPAFNDHFLAGGIGTAPGVCNDPNAGTHVMGMGCTMKSDAANLIMALVAAGAADTVIPDITANVPTNAMITSTAVRLYEDSGAMKVTVSGAPLCMIFLWLEATGRYV